MTKSKAFLAQAASDFHVFELLLRQDRADVPACHPGHYLQMSMEKLAKAALQRTGHDPGYTHEAFSALRPHLKRRDVARALGYSNFSIFRDFLDRSAGLFHQREQIGVVGRQIARPCCKKRRLLPAHKSRGMIFSNAFSVASGVFVVTQPKRFVMRCMAYSVKL